MTVDDYIAKSNDKQRVILSQLRSLILNSCPEAIESISYKMPAYKLKNKPLIYFAAYKNHIGLYALPTSHSKFANELISYKQGKGSVQFPIDHEIPYPLIIKIIEFRIEEITKTT